MSNFLDSLIAKLDSKAVQLVKKIVLGVFILLIVLDIIFVAVDGIPTISMVVHDSSPTFMVLIWLFGLFVTNVFFQRTANAKEHTTRNFIILAAITILLLVGGLLIKQPTHINCENYSVEIEKAETPYLTRIKCHDYSFGLADYKNYDCLNHNCNDDVRFKLDLTVGVKFALLILGILLGYVFWPAYEEKNK